MKMKFITSGRIEQGFVLIGKSGSIRFKSEFAKLHGFAPGQKWRMGVDSSESPAKHVFIIKPDPNNPQEGFKMSFQNKSWALAAKLLLYELKLTPPLKCKIEEFKDGEYEGFKITLPK
jgi:hypothetical protein